MSLQEIADACGILAGSLYHHFDSKEAIITELISLYKDDLGRVAREATDELDDDNDHPFPERIVRLSEAIVACATRHRAALLQTLYEPPSSASANYAALPSFVPDEIIEAMLATLRVDRAHGYIKPDIDLSMLATQLCNSMFNFAVGTFHAAPEAKQVPRTKCRMLLEGLVIDAPSNAYLERSEAFRTAQDAIGAWEQRDGDDQMAILKNAARKEFSRRGFEIATVRDIAVAAKMSTGAVYRMTGSKDNLLKSVMKGYVEASSTGWDALLESRSSPIEKLDALIWVNINLLARFSEEVNIQLAWLREAPPQPWGEFPSFSKRLGQLRALLEDGERKGQFQDNGANLNIRGHCLLELSWFPKTIVLTHGVSKAHALARANLLRGAAVR